MSVRTRMEWMGMLNTQEVVRCGTNLTACLVHYTTDPSCVTQTTQTLVNGSPWGSPVVRWGIAGNPQVRFALQYLQV